MFCRKCGNTIYQENLVCPNCGFDNELKNDGEQLKQLLSSKEFKEVEQRKKWSVWNITAIISFCCAIFSLFKGFDKMLNYSSGETYPYKSINAYVGGDAYNYIINGTHTTALFILGLIFVILGMGFLIMHFLIENGKGQR